MSTGDYDLDQSMEHQKTNTNSLTHRLISRFPSLYILFNRKNKGIKNGLINIKGYRAIKKNKLFDVEYYLRNNPDVNMSRMDPIMHYIYHGFKESRNPSAAFDGDFYIKTHADVRNSNLNPLVHYSLYGMEEKRKTQNTISDIPDYTHLKKTLKGKNRHLFLINDSNNEIKQHFDKHYNNNFKADFFSKVFHFKSKFCKENDIRYYFFIVPDKSLVCKEFLPFDTGEIKRNHDLIGNLALDFIENLDHNCYFKNDSHINSLGGKRLSYHYLNYIEKDFLIEDFDELIDKQIITKEILHNGDLTMEGNWSYSNKERNEYINEKSIMFNNKYRRNLDKNLPEKYKFANKRETEYYENIQGLTNLKVLILRDSSYAFLKGPLSVYFKEILLYWDHWYFNKELIEWYKPDIILDIKTERFLENMEQKIYELNLQTPLY